MQPTEKGESKGIGRGTKEEREKREREEGERSQMNEKRIKNKTGNKGEKTKLIFEDE
jgi:hypothetical protein